MVLLKVQLLCTHPEDENSPSLLTGTHNFAGHLLGPPVNTGGWEAWRAA